MASILIEDANDWYCSCLEKAGHLDDWQVADLVVFDAKDIHLSIWVLPKDQEVFTCQSTIASTIEKVSSCAITAGSIGINLSTGKELSGFAHLRGVEIGQGLGRRQDKGHRSRGMFIGSCRGLSMVITMVVISMG